MNKKQPQSLPISYDTRYLTIDSVQLSDSGNYFCYGKDLESQRLVVSNVQLIVYGKTSVFNNMLVQNYAP